MRRIVLAPLILALFSPVLAENSISKKAHQACKDVKDYKGCIEMRSDKKQKKNEKLTRETQRDDKKGTIILFNPTTVIARKIRGEWGRYLSYRYFAIRGSRQGEWSVDADCQDYTADWKGDEEPWRNLRAHKRDSSKEALKILDEFCPQMDRLVKAAKKRETSGSKYLPFQYPPSNVRRGGGGSSTVINQYSSSPTYNYSPPRIQRINTTPTTSNIQGISGRINSNPYGGY